MKETRAEMRGLLESDEDKVLRDTWYEYSDDQELPTPDRPSLIEAILDLMEKHGDIQSDIVQESFRLPDLARELKVNPKVAREKYRRAVRKGTAPESLRTTGWSFHIKDKAAVSAIIKLRKKP